MVDVCNNTLMEKIMKRLFAIFGISISTMSFAAQLTEGEFTQYFTKQAAETLKDVQFKIVQPLQVNSKDVNGYELTVFLNNAYAQYASSPDNLRFIVDSHIQSIKSQSQLIASKTGGSILAVVKPADYLESVRKQLAQAGGAGKEISLVYEKINDELYAFFVFDTERGMRMVSKKDLAENKIDEKTIRAVATHNLAMHFEKKGVNIRRLEKIGNAKVYVVSLDENYEASILLLNKYWNKQTFDVTGDIVAFVPARNLVFVTGSMDAEGMRIAGSLANRGFKELGYAISPKGYTYDVGTWKP